MNRRSLHFIRTMSTTPNQICGVTSKTRQTQQSRIATRHAASTTQKLRVKYTCGPRNARGWGTHEHCPRFVSFRSVLFCFVSSRFITFRLTPTLPTKRTALSPLGKPHADGIGAVGTLPEDGVEGHSAGGQALEPGEKALGMIGPAALGVVADPVRYRPALLSSRSRSSRSPGSLAGPCPAQSKGSPNRPRTQDG